MEHPHGHADTRVRTAGGPRGRTRLGLAPALLLPSWEDGDQLESGNRLSELSFFSFVKWK